MSSDDLQLLQGYYELRASEYDSIYDFSEPERRKELDEIESLVSKTFKGKSVLEIACGTGYWTERLAKVSDKIFATDYSEAMLEVARARNYSQAKTTFEQFDAYRLETITETFDSALAGFWMSHVPKKRMQEFLSGLQSRLKPGAPVLFLDNNLVAGMGGAVIERSDSNDSYKERKLNDGSTHVILKNYFTDQNLHSLLEPYSSELAITMGRWYWSALYLSK